MKKVTIMSDDDTLGPFLSETAKNWLQKINSAKDPTRLIRLVDGDKVVAHRKSVTDTGEVIWYTSIFEFVRLIESKKWAKELDLDCDWFVEMRPHMTSCGSKLDSRGSENVIYTIARVEIYNA